MQALAGGTAQLRACRRACPTIASLHSEAGMHGKQNVQDATAKCRCRRGARARRLAAQPKMVVPIVAGYPAASGHRALHSLPGKGSLRRDVKNRIAPLRARQLSRKPRTWAGGSAAPRLPCTPPPPSPGPRGAPGKPGVASHSLIGAGPASREAPHACWYAPLLAGRRAPLRGRAAPGALMATCTCRRRRSASPPGRCRCWYT